MTVKYDGGDIYILFLENREIILHKSEIDEIQEWNFEENREYESRQELEEKIEKLEYLIYDVKYSIKNDDVQSLDDIVKMLEN